MRFWSPFTYFTLATGFIACSVYDESLLPTDEDTRPVINASTNSSNSTSSGSTPTSSTGTSVQSANSSTSTTGSDSGGTGGDGGDGGTGGTDTATTDGGNGGSGNAAAEATTTGSGAGNMATTTGSGTGGTGGTTVQIDPTLIDDLEDGDTALERPTFSGYWFTAVDTTGTGDVTPAPGEERDGIVMLDDPRGRVMHVFGQWEGDNWAAAVGFSFLTGEDDFDATGYRGISFWARSDEPMTNVNVQFLTSGVTDDGHWAYEITDLLSEDWQKITIDFDDAIQPSWADTVPFDEATLYKIQFQFNVDPFDLWLDDVRFEE